MGSLSAPVALVQHHDLENFDCGEPSLNDWLRKRALGNAATGASKTFVVCDVTKVAAYYALALGAVDQRASTGKLRRNMPDPIPVMVIGRLAVDQAYRGSGVARGLVKDAIARTLKVSEHAGVRGILVHAVSDEAVRFWTSVGFTSSPLEERLMMITLSDALSALSAEFR